METRTFGVAAQFRLNSKLKTQSSTLAVGVFGNTFDPIHYGHMDIATRAARLFDEVIMAVYDKPLKSLLFAPEERMSWN